ncbi:MAG: bifunctional diaminohydroxyphosphoribosylaminopyrimidine deaminase/5-amino-6-(5-phosphoribosylamino)uracil reductase RibD, partial [Ktedonobacteraceae bacterium]|nr:bifunctional diaminohydroxyphosphoribosylaminopyrimidine deaminase/5-amino-6-(5-phosphoribosylamino)uracil reductase RibD [Ktedonobacteraceae bacterium]
MDDLKAMQQALALARFVEGRTAPRPPVGALLVRDGIPVGRGATAPPFGPHAEVEAIREAGEAAQGATLYVTLEPCCITVHTSPCTEAIINAGIKRVVIGTIDPNPRVSGRGIALLRDAGIEVVPPLDMPEARALVQPFATFITQHRPFVTAKWAMTLDGKLATTTGDSRWISGVNARAWVHDLRDRVDAILIGSGTALIDNPQLTVRLPQALRASRPLPWRLICSTHGNLPSGLRLLEPDLAERTCILVGETCPPNRQEALIARGVQVLSIAEDGQGRLDLHSALQALASRDIMHVLLEGGSTLLGDALDRQLIDHVATFVAPRLVGGSHAPSPIGGLGAKKMEQAWRLR